MMSPRHEAAGHLKPVPVLDISQHGLSTSRETSHHPSPSFPCNITPTERLSSPDFAFLSLAVLIILNAVYTQA